MRRQIHSHHRNPSSLMGLDCRLREIIQYALRLFPIMGYPADRSRRDFSMAGRVQKCAACGRAPWTGAGRLPG